MDVRRFLNQTVQYRGRGTVNPRTGEVTPGPVQILPARVEEKQNLVRDSSGSQVVSTTEVWTELEPDIQGKINGNSIRARESLTRVNGQVVGWKSFL